MGAALSYPTIVRVEDSEPVPRPAAATHYPHRHRAHGLTIASSLPLPELATASGAADLVVSEGSVPQSLPAATTRGVLFELDQTRCLINLDRIAGARFLVRDGREIVVERRSGADDRAIRLFLLGSCFAAALFQRRHLPLHASAVLTRDGAVLFSGESGVGKSTLAAHLWGRGYTIIADDVSTIHFDPRGRPLVATGVRQIRLWANALDHLEIDPRPLERVRPDLEKYALPLEDDGGEGLYPIRRIVLLSQHNDSVIETRPITGMEKLPRVQGAVYRGEFLGFDRHRIAFFPQITRLAGAVEVTEARYPHDSSRQEELVDRLIAEIGV